MHCRWTSRERNFSAKYTGSDLGQWHFARFLNQGIGTLIEEGAFASCPTLFRKTMHG